MNVIAILLAIALATVVTVLPSWGELYVPGAAEPDNRRAGD